MATFVLVHAAWGGGWEWRRVANILQAGGHEVFTPTLTGLGERAHLARPKVGLDTHVEDVLAVLACEELTGAILSGHSSAGMVITGVIDRARDRIAHAVYIDAVVPQAGQALVDLLPPRFVENTIRGPARRSGEGWRIPCPFGPEELGMTAEDAAWYLSKAVPQPLRTFEQPLELGEGWASVPVFTYVHCVERTDYLARFADDDKTESPFGPFARRAREQGWRYREIQSTHDPHITAPAEIAALLEEVAVPNSSI